MPESLPMRKKIRYSGDPSKPKRKPNANKKGRKKRMEMGK